MVLVLVGSNGFARGQLRGGGQEDAGDMVALGGREGGGSLGVVRLDGTVLAVVEKGEGVANIV